MITTAFSLYAHSKAEVLFFFACCSEFTAASYYSVKSKLAKEIDSLATKDGHDVRRDKRCGAASVD